MKGSIPLYGKLNLVGSRRVEAGIYRCKEWIFPLKWKKKVLSLLLNKSKDKMNLVRHTENVRNM